ncbi:hypothetical protein HYV64_04090 [Candidatus Shapirobacteria bacterium]|nr:hypothetical protein [Candidatus Shapirobacteria bacterium]
MSRADALDGYFQGQHLSALQEKQLRDLSHFQPAMVGELNTHVMRYCDVGPEQSPLYIDQTVNSIGESYLPWFVDFDRLIHR